jgi:hypothetical protein
MAGFAFYQWVQLEWPQPDAIVPMPDKHSVEIGRALADLMDASFATSLRKSHSYREESLEEEATLLLFDSGEPFPLLQKAVESLLEAFPKNIYVLSLFPYVDHSPHSIHPPRHLS